MKKRLLVVPAVGALLLFGGGVAVADPIDEAAQQEKVADKDPGKVKKVHTDNGGGNDPDPCDIATQPETCDPLVEVPLIP